MSSNSKGSKNGQLQIITAKVDEMKVPNISQTPSGAYCFRMVVPRDVRETLPRDEPGQQRKANIWIPLGNDRKAARIRGEELNALWHRRIENERRRLKQEEPLPKSPTTPSEYSPRGIVGLRPLSTLSVEEIKQVFIGYFVRREIAGFRWRVNTEMLDDFARKKLIDEFEEVLKSPPALKVVSETENTLQCREITREEFYSLPDFGLEPFFRKAGVCIDAASRPDLQFYASFFLLTIKESIKRDLEALKGNLSYNSNPYLPTPEILADPKAVSQLLKTPSGITVGQLCQAFIQSKEEAGLSPSSMKHVRNSSSVISSFFGENTPLKNIAFEDGKHFARFLKTIPLHYKLRYSGTSLLKAAEKESRAKQPRVISKKTASMHYDYAMEMFKNVQELFELRTPYSSPLLDKFRSFIPDDPLRVDYSEKCIVVKS